MNANPLALIAAAFFIWTSTAIGQEYDWIIPKLTEAIKDADKQSVAKGQIEGQDYLAIQMDAGNQTAEGFKPVLVFARIRKNSSYEPFDVWELPSLLGLSVAIRNDSIYVRHDTAHHGVYFSTYQFKLRSGSFQLVGIENQSITPAAYAGIMKNRELWQGTSANLLTAKAIVWAQSFDMDNPREYRKWELALQKHNNGLPATEGKREKVTIRPIPPVELRQFDPYTFHEDFLCHAFDHNLRFHNYCGK